MRYTYFLIVFILPIGMMAQNGGKSAFQFLNIECSPRVEALGGYAIAIFDDDVGLSQTAPSLLNQDMHNEISFTYGDYFSDISLLSFSYANKYKNFGVIGVSLKAISYGVFDRNDANGNNNGTFSANDQLLTLGIGKQINGFWYLGLNLNLINSNYDTYSSSALSSNISATYNHEEKKITSTILIKNIGRQLTSYTSKIENFPYEIQAAISKELLHLPLRYHLTYNNINIFDIKSSYKLLNQTNILTGDVELKEESFGKTFLRHIIIGAELNPFRRNLFIRSGFNFQRRFDLSTITKPSLVGFSFGIGFRVSKYHFDYSRSSYHLAGTPNNFSIATNLSTFGF